MKFNVHVRGNTDPNSPPWPGSTVTTCMSDFTTGGPVRNMKLTSHHQLEELGKGQKGEKGLRGSGCGTLGVPLE